MTFHHALPHLPRLPLLAIACCFAGLLAPAGAHAAEPTRPDVLLITVDTLRPDALGWVAGTNATPHLDALAAAGVRFAGAVSPVPITLPAHSSLMTALIPPRHGVRDNGQLLGTGARTLAETLEAEGYATGAFVSGYPLSPEFGLDRGFDHYDGVLAADGGPLERSAEETTARALAWLKTAPRPWFLWVHYYDPHDPYQPPARFLRPGPRGAYDGEVAVVDEAVGGLLEAADKVSGPLLTVFTADHAESLGEHGERTHGFFVYDSTVLVPLVFRLPGKLKPLEPKAELESRPRLVDVAPTILDLVGLEPWNGVDGVSLVPLLFGRSQAIPAAYVESRRPWLSYGWAPLKGMRREGWKLIVSPRPELYNLIEDPGETVDRIDVPPNPARRIASALRSAEQQPVMASSSAVDAETLARLRALGYTGGGGGTDREPPPDLPDPKDRIGAWNLLGEAEAELQAGRPAAALERFDAVLEQEPGNPFALARSGFASLELDRVADAVRRLELAVAKAPEQPEIHFTLAHALGRLGRHADAASEWREVLRLQPRRVAAWSGLGTSLGLSGHAGDAVDAFRRASELAPEDPEIRIRLAFAEHGAGQAAAAVTSLLAAARLTGDDAFPHPAALGLLLAAADRSVEAIAWLRRSRPEEGDYARARFELARLELAADHPDAARRALAEALGADPRLAAEAARDPALSGLQPH